MTTTENAKEKSWKEFRDSGLLWWVNMIIHTFGWAIVYEIENGALTRVYPARVKYRGFDEKSNDEGYRKITEYMEKNANCLLKECTIGVDVGAASGDKTTYSRHSGTIIKAGEKP